MALVACRSSATLRKVGATVTPDEPIDMSAMEASKITPRGGHEHDRGGVEAHGESPRYMIFAKEGSSPRFEITSTSIPTRILLGHVPVVDCRHSLPLLGHIIARIDPATPCVLHINDIVGTITRNTDVYYGTMDFDPHIVEACKEDKAPYRPYSLVPFDPSGVAVVVKAYPIRVLKDRKEVVAEYFCREVASSVVLTSLGVGALMEVVMDPTKEYAMIVSKRFHGGDLHAYLSLWYKRGSLQMMPKDNYDRVMVMLIAAVRRMHANSMVHHDLKPENVLVRAVGDMAVDLALIDGEYTETVDFAHGSEIPARGTPEYASPEKIIPCGPVHDTRCVDVWSVGVILYSTLFLRIPYFLEEGSSVDDLYAMITTYRIDYPPNPPAWCIPLIALFQRIFVPSVVRPTIFEIWASDYVQSARDRLVRDMTFRLETEPKASAMRYTFRRWLYILNDGNHECYGPTVRHPQTSATFNLVYTSTAKKFGLRVPNLPFQFKSTGMKN